MASLTEQLRALGFRLDNYGIGDHDSICPACSHLRKKKTAKCCTVTIKADHVLICCHHCHNFKPGRINDNGTQDHTAYRGSPGAARKKGGKARPSRKTWLADLRGS